MCIRDRSYINLIKRALVFDPQKRASFSELLADPFFNIVVLQPKLRTFPYLQQELIGTGSMLKTQVFKCKRAGQILAMKVIDSRGIEKKRLLGEIDTLTKLKNSSNIIRIQDYFRIRDKVYLIQNYYEGGNLEEYVEKKAGDGMSVDEQVYVAYCVLNGINDIHTHNIIHRDIHPKNILLSLNSFGSISNAIISDFGFARILLDETAGTKIYTAYRSPEMTLPEYHGKHDAKTDIWSYGMLLYFLVFGAHVDRCEGNHNLTLVLRKGEVRFDERKAEKSAELVCVMKECLKVDPASRPSAAQLLAKPVFAKYKSKSF
eukprot:TRINITY_DN8210_c0_g7_i3.p1 TRINITY_DN8210_c0_g7~~TRINITY_DN8210_c0_g7_i3.p1  ORF type:complete len:317 (+),score=81.62 TRINITY_DN8210_c0_g7_i3:73-1023(+)